MHLDVLAKTLINYFYLFLFINVNKLHVFVHIGPYAESLADGLQC